MYVREKGFRWASLMLPQKGTNGTQNHFGSLCFFAARSVFVRACDYKYANALAARHSHSKTDVMNNRYDVVVIGGGHNGLVNAAYLARAGKKVLVLERRHVLGGAAVTEEVFPGFKFSVCSYVV